MNSVGKWGKRQASKQGALLPLGSHHHRQHDNMAKSVALLWQIPKALSPYNIIGVLRQRNMAQMKNRAKLQKKELSDKETDNLSVSIPITRVQNTGNQDAHRNG